MPLDNALSVLRDRAAYLALRAAAKRQLGWEYCYDERERAALQLVIDALSPQTGRIASSGDAAPRVGGGA